MVCALAIEFELLDELVRRWAGERLAALVAAALVLDRDGARRYGHRSEADEAANETLGLSFLCVPLTFLLVQLTLIATRARPAAS